MLCTQPPRKAVYVLAVYVYTTTTSLLFPTVRAAGAPVSACFCIPLCWRLSLHVSACPMPCGSHPQNAQKHTPLCEAPFTACGVAARGLHLSSPYASPCGMPGLLTAASWSCVHSLLHFCCGGHDTASWGPVSHTCPCLLHSRCFLHCVPLCDFPRSCCFPCLCCGALGVCGCVTSFPAAMHTCNAAPELPITSLCWAFPARWPDCCLEFCISHLWHGSCCLAEGPLACVYRC
jgi:hypothetical protein